MTPLEKDFLARAKQDTRRGWISKCRAVTTRDRLCKRSALNFDVGRIPYVGKKLNQKLMDKLTGKVRYKGQRCCYLCYQHLGLLIAETVKQNPKYQRTIVENAILLSLKTYGVGPSVLIDVKNAFKIPV